MRKSFVAVLCAVLASSSLSLPAAATSKTSSGSIVIVFKDGHRQTFNLADIERIEFPGGAYAGTSGSTADGPPRGRYFGKWECGDGAGGHFTITLNENGSAYRSIGNERGHWSYTNGDALITWDDGSKDAIRRVGNRYQKSAYGSGKSFTDQPDNVADAHNVTPKPI